MKKAVSLPKLKKKADLLFAEYIRLRDEGLPCISCNQPKEYLQAGHYYAKQGFDGLRYDPFNTNGECAKCNCFDESHLIGYGENLRIKIGPIEFDLLKLRATDYKQRGHKWSRSELENLIKHYQAKIKELKEVYV